MDSSALILQELQSINYKLDTLTEKIDELAEQEEITRSGVNSLIEWAEGVGTAIQIPFAESQE